MTGEDYVHLDRANALLVQTPIHAFLGFTIDALDPPAGTLTMSAPVSGNSDRFGESGQAHGGAIATLIDSAATFACCAHLARSVPTMNMRVDYLRPAVGDRMVATAIVRRAGRTAAVIDVEVHAGGKLVAIGRCGQSTAN